MDRRRTHAGRWPIRKHGRTLALTVALCIAIAGEACAQPAAPAEDAGVVVRVDERHGVVILDSGQMVRATPATVILADGNPVTLGSLRPGARVVIRSADPVVFRSGQYVQLSDSPAASVTGSSVRARTFGRVKDVDRDGDVTIETKTGAFHIDVSPDAARTLKKGDTVTVEVIITAPPPTVR
jgi:hypothetical protein